MKIGDDCRSPLGRDRMDRAARLLADRGFSILRVGRRGVSVQADARTFDRELGVAPDLRGSVVKAPPVGSALSEVIDLVEIADAPISL